LRFGVGLLNTALPEGIRSGRARVEELLDEDPRHAQVLDFDCATRRIQAVR
jgi:hypothetical protein